MFKTVKEGDKGKVTKEKNIFLTKEPTTSLLSVKVQYSDEIDT